MDPREKILNDSLSKINKLKIYVNFFKLELLTDVFSRIQSIHTTFEYNSDLAIDRLQIFNEQYTVSLIKLLSELKSDAEKRILLLDEDILKLTAAVEDISSKKTRYDEDRLFLEKEMRILLKNIYLVLSDQKKDSALTRPFIEKFHAIHKDFSYRKINEQQYLKYSFIDNKAYYISNDVVMSRKLLGILNKTDFGVSYCYGLIFGLSYIDIFKADSIYFSYISNLNLFSICEVEEGSDVFSVNRFNDYNKLILLQNKREILKTITNDSILGTLVELKEKLSKSDFLAELQKIDMQNVILKTMIKTEIL